MTRRSSRMAQTSLLFVLLLMTSMVGCGKPLAHKNESFTRVDPAKGRAQADDKWTWYDGQQLLVEGKGWTDTEGFYDRLPTRAKELVTPSVWGLSKDSAGLCVRFATEATQLSARWTLKSSSLAMTHMPATGVSGLDFYVRQDGAWHWFGIGRPGSVKNECTCAVTLSSPGIHEYMIYLPLYNGVKSLEIGIPTKAQLYLPPARTAKPICVYGTSIAQGGCASRPGMAHVAILGRRLDRPMINLGFSGSGKMEPAMATLLGELDVAAYVLDCLPNMTDEMVNTRVEPFVTLLRKARPTTPIILVENQIPQGSVFLPRPERKITPKNAALEQVYRQFVARGERNMRYVRGELLLGDDGDATVDGTHPTDLGFIRIADAQEPVLRQVTASR